MKPSADARICDHKCDRLAAGSCVICEKDTCFDHGARPMIAVSRGSGREMHFMLDLVVCHDCQEQMEKAQITGYASGTGGLRDDAFVAHIKDGGKTIFEGVKARIAGTALRRQ